MAGEELLTPGVFVVPGPPVPSFVVFGGPLLLYPPSDPVSLASYALSLEASPEPCGPLAKRGRGIVGRAVGVIARNGVWGLGRRQTAKL